MNFRIFSLGVICISGTVLNAMEQKSVIHAGLAISARSAAYPSPKLTQAINNAGITAKPLEPVIHIETTPTIPGMPSYLPVRDLALSQTGTTLPFIVNGQEVILTCRSNQVSNLSFETQLDQCIRNFNVTPLFAHRKQNLKEHRALRNLLTEHGLIQSKTTTQLGPISIITPEHTTRFKPLTTPRKNLYNHVRNREIGLKKRPALTQLSTQSSQSTTTE